MHGCKVGLGPCNFHGRSWAVVHPGDRDNHAGGVEHGDGTGLAERPSLRDTAVDHGPRLRQREVDGVVLGHGDLLPNGISGLLWRNRRLTRGRASRTSHYLPHEEIARIARSY